ncbi:MAG: hypothetical protein GX671_01350, partial [Clostridiales bacterium]|nr:hypothetical protein [Clostridiales bacterium]
MLSGISVIILANSDGTSTTDTTSSGTTDSKYVTSNTVYVPMHRISSLNPLSSKDDDTYYITQMIYSSLFELDSDLNIKKDLVSSYTTHSGSVSIKLKNADFSDGSSLTAEDVIYTVREIKSIGSKSPYYVYANKI